MSKFKQEIEAGLKQALCNLGGGEIKVVLTVPDNPGHGDYTTNVAMVLAKQVGDQALDLAQKIVTQLSSLPSLTNLVKIEVAGPGFINFYLADQILWQALELKPTLINQGKIIVVEYSDPNPFKMLHAGHVYTTVVGEAIARLLEQSGAIVHRVNFGGDVGLHVGKTIWAIVQNLGGEHPEKLAAIVPTERSRWLSARYVEGHRAYEDDPAAKIKIIAYNKQVYQIQAEPNHTSPLAQIYWTGRAWSYEAFDAFYARVGTQFEKYYPESEVTRLGLQTVRENVGKVFVESEGAVVFKGEEFGLHTRVFINRDGLPTYETKDVGLIAKKAEDYQFDRSIIVTDNEQKEYLAVVMKAVEQFWPKLVAATTHIPHGKLKLLGGVKMSSRLGNIVPAEEVLEVTALANQKARGDSNEQIVLGAVKYAFCKQRLGGDIIYDPAESVALEGNSGPYLQYAYARAKSILTKADFANANLELTGLEAGERALVRKLGEATEVIDRAVIELKPHYICTYLYELAQEFNRFYEHNRVIGDHREQLRLALISYYAETLKNGLGLLGIAAPAKM